MNGVEKEKKELSHVLILNRFIYNYSLNDRSRRSLSRSLNSALVQCTIPAFYDENTTP